MPSLLHTGYMQTKLGMQWMELKWPSKKVCLVQGGGGGVTYIDSFPTGVKNFGR